MLQEMLEDLTIESQFESGVQHLLRGEYHVHNVFSGECLQEWGVPFIAVRESSQMTYMPEMLDMLKQARREKVANIPPRTKTS